MKKKDIERINLPRGLRRQLPETNPFGWTEKKLPLREIGPEPPLNKEGFWKKREYPEIKVNKDGGK